MPVVKPSVRGFTHQDFLDGKCTKEGFALGTEVNDEKPLAPEQPTEEPSGDSSDSEESPNDTDGQDNSGEEANPTPA